jgi:hypothetical protein
MTDFKRDDLDWRCGRHAAFVWHADDAVEMVAGLLGAGSREVSTAL